MNFIRCLIAGLFCLAAIPLCFAQTPAPDTKPVFVKFKTDPPGGFLLVDAEKYPAPDSAIGWTSVKLTPGSHSVVVKGQGKRATFDLLVDPKRGAFVTVDFDDELVWSLLEKAYRSKVIPATFEKDDATVATKPKEVAKAPEVAVVDTGKTDSLPTLIADIKPILKDTSKVKDLKGPVMIRVQVNERGNVIEARIDRSSGVRQFDQAALEAAKKCKYKPATRKGIPIASWLTYPVEYKPQVGTGEKVDE